MNSTIPETSPRSYQELCRQIDIVRNLQFPLEQLVKDNRNSHLYDLLLTIDRAVERAHQLLVRERNQTQAKQHTLAEYIAQITHVPAGPNLEDLPAAQRGPKS